LAEKTTAIIMTAVESRYFLRINGHPQFAAQLPDIDKSTPVIVHCKSGYRSMIACSLLKKAGHTAVTNLIGGYDAWEQSRP